MAATESYYAHLDLTDLAEDADLVMAVRRWGGTLLREESAPTNQRSGPKARTGFEPVYEALQASA